MKTKFLLILSFILNFSFAQNTKQFRKLFQEIDTEILHLYSFSRMPLELPNRQNYPYKGVKIDRSFYPIIQDKFQIQGDVFFATYRIKLSPNIEGLILRNFQNTGEEHHLSCILYDVLKAQFIGSQNLANSANYEGYSGFKQSWIIDLNQDGVKDIMSYRSNSYFSFEHETPKEVFKENIELFILNKNKFIKTQITDTTLVENLKKDFPTKPTYLRYTTEKQLAKFLKPTPNWAIIIGSDQNIPSSEYELNKAKKKFLKHKKFLNKHFGIHTRNGKYYANISNFKTFKEANEILVQIKTKFNSNAYIIDLNKHKNRKPIPE